MALEEAEDVMRKQVDQLGAGVVDLREAEAVKAVWAVMMVLWAVDMSTSSRRAKEGSSAWKIWVDRRVLFQGRDIAPHDLWTTGNAWYEAPRGAQGEIRGGRMITFD